MNIIPAIDILGGRCVRLYQGDYKQTQIFNDNPVDVAKRWADEGATKLHLVDLDAAKVGQPVNQKTIEAIIKAVDIPIQVGGGLRNYSTVASLLALGVQQAILGTVAIEQPELVSDFCQKFPGQIIVGIDARDGKVATKGWLETSQVLATDLALQMAKLKVAAIIYTDIHRDGTLKGPNIEALRELATAVSIPVIASGGISSINDLLNLLALETIGVKGAIVGRALYTGGISLKEANQAVGQGRWQDVPPNLGSSTFV
ncbi:1-(5-phosphoribosyl)-5-[(5-phosphoribosylamino)methylideneamino] imidazole-4-carboxamide isomerase [Trichodesmium erythraeum IMS101]|uniref:1-(5-phosphoribosyl)-5-[(5-phosphoribosylamino)methylideneamino] imidazole-4-carboxamide isomerase n=1 Tax=Trichodesmium erythraeum (strain IMS101) TaxID=203124 RepID=HIS4_TRIEI|nr:RecName: Full=1-(5-phosphoribosyl)-5-[(5-phosphoribosylamino)methylideneamino] imidazole-4-carboxamide isomerase; AltName: Full=Phosphoribosylformimino-5-aminoimidazole carboxamide ribotide isomerase [Trichodesmium erythraeum IMS101]MBS9771092.1 1-(5-phosphoribosyl)-5-[(5-phosphoribosylamino)methylideneamino]imidazole-4-carboxamide isomerase [Trichodesmium erythraeum GBRTRLIN201]MDT9338301.1 1-(5-phosphoribosyl)-5-[(5-phosphoribosylamino)methylideneamino]imidazole-4-carboxamide isomerase [Tric